MLLIYGVADQVFPYDLARYLFVSAGEPKELVLYSDDGHGIERHRLEMLKKLCVGGAWICCLTRKTREKNELTDLPEVSPITPRPGFRGRPNGKKGLMPFGVSSYE